VIAVFIISCFALALIDEANSSHRDPISEIFGVRSLTPEEADESRPVKITGIVTLSNPDRPEIFLQDETGGIYVQAESMPAEICQGSQVQIVGHTSKGFFSPYVNAASVTILGEAPLPPPASFDLSQSNSRWLDAHCVLSHGLVREVVEVNGQIRVNVEGTGGSAMLEFREIPTVEELRPFIGTVVRIRGVCVPEFDENWNVTGNVRVILQSKDELAIVESVERLASTPVRTILDLRKFVPAVSPIPFARMAGIVNAHPFNDVLLVQDATGGCIVRLRNVSVQQISPGTHIEVSGFLAWVGNHVELRSAVATIGKTEALPAPRDIATPSDLAGSIACRVRLIGKIAKASPGGWTIVGDHGTVMVRLPADFKNEVEAGSEVSVVGTLTMLSDDSGNFRLLPIASGDLTVISSPPRPLITGTGLAVAGSIAALMMLISAVWVVMLRRSVQLRTQQLTAAQRDA
jgi:hypothetical protein